METESAFVSNRSSQCDPNTDVDRYLLTSDLDFITALSVLLAVVALFTVFANCIVISAIARAYIYGISSSGPRVKSSSQEASKPNNRCGDLVNGHRNKSPQSTPGTITTKFQNPHASTQCLDSMHARETGLIISSKEVPCEAVGTIDVDVILSDTVPKEAAAINGSERTDETPRAKPSLTTSDENLETARKICTSSSITSEKDKQRDPFTIETGRSHRCESQASEHIRCEKTVAPLTFRKKTRLGTDSSSIPIVLMFSMAVSDALLGAVVMPLSILEIVNNGAWPFGSLSCMVRTTFDVILSTTSIYHVTCMAADRYLAICRPLLHRKLTVRMGVLATAVCWILPLCMVTLFSVFHLVSTKDTINISSADCSSSVLSQTILPISNQTNMNRSRKSASGTSGLTTKEITECFQNVTVLAQAVLVTICFYIPFLVLFFLYFFVLFEIYGFSKRREVLQEASNRQREMQRRNQTANRSILVSKGLSNEGTTSDSSNTGKLHQEQTQSFRVPLSKRLFSGKKYVLNSKKVRSSAKRNDIEETGIINQQCTSTRFANLNGQGSETGSKDFIIPTSRSAKQRCNTGSDSILARKSTDTKLKAVKTIGLLVACFIVCWLPFSIMIMVLSVTNGGISNWAVLLITWLGYINSSLNPFLYCGHRTIRAAITEMLCGPQRTTF